MLPVSYPKKNNAKCRVVNAGNQIGCRFKEALQPAEFHGRVIRRKTRDQSQAAGNAHTMLVQTGLSQ
jgi:hypothetical protein